MRYAVQQSRARENWSANQLLTRRPARIGKRLHEGYPQIVRIPTDVSNKKGTNCREMIYPRNLEPTRQHRWCNAAANGTTLAGALDGGARIGVCRIGDLSALRLSVPAAFETIGLKIMSAYTLNQLQPAGLHSHVAGGHCPWCDQPIPNAKRDEIERRIEAREQELLREMTSRLAEQHAKEKRDAELRAKAEIEAARMEARTAAEQAASGKIAEAEAARLAAISEIAALKASLEATLKARESEIRLALEKERIAAIQAEQTKAFEERQKFQSKIMELQRQLENKTAQELGEGAEVDLFEALKSEFPEDRISRVEKGLSGADIVHDIHHAGAFCGRIVYDAKNRNAWRNEYVSKLRQDQMDANADHAVLASRVFPAGVKELHSQDGVLIISPQRVVVLAALLRRHVLQTHALRLSNEARAEKTEALYAFIMSERCTQLLSAIETHADDLLDLDRKEERAHQQTWKRRAELIRSVQRSRDDLSSQIERIIGTRGEEG